MPDQTPDSADEDLFEISAVARLTGLSTHNLRVWERRHRVVEPSRSGTSRRLYSREDVRKLGLLKALVDRGHSISRLAKLDSAQLDARLRDSETEQPFPAAAGKADRSSGQDGQRRCRVAVAGLFLLPQLREQGPLSQRLRVVSEFETLEQMQQTLRPGSVDVVIIEEATLFEDRIEAIQRLLSSTKARRAVVTYRFANSATLERIETDLVGIAVLRAPANATEIRLACLVGMDLPASDFPSVTLPHSPAAETGSSFPTIGDDAEAVSESGVPERVFGDAELAAIGSQPNPVKCECPQHLVNLITSLLAFEKYSSECENRNADDARLHSYLHRATAQARRSMEVALTAVMQSKDFEFPN